MNFEHIHISHIIQISIFPIISPPFAVFHAVDMNDSGEWNEAAGKSSDKLCQIMQNYLTY